MMYISTILYIFQKIFEESIDSQVGFRSVLCDSWQDFEVIIILKSYLIIDSYIKIHMAYE